MLNQTKTDTAATLEAATLALAQAQINHDTRQADLMDAKRAISTHKNGEAESKASASKATALLADLIAKGAQESERTAVRAAASDHGTLAFWHAAEVERIAATLPEIERLSQWTGLQHAKQAFNEAEFADATARYVEKLKDLVPMAVRLRSAAARLGRSTNNDAGTNALLIDPAKPRLFGQLVDLSGAFDPNAPIAILPR